MKKTSLILLIAMVASLVSAESVLKPVNDQGFGTISGRIQSLTMYRDFEGVTTGANSSLGAILGYTSPERAGFDLGVAYNYAGEIYQENNSTLMANEPIHVLNEVWLRYNFGIIGLTNTTIQAGRRINNGEIFQSNDFRQQSRSIEAVQFETADIDNTKVTVGHAIRMSNWILKNDMASFNRFGEVFDGNIADQTEGITWGEVVNNNVEGLEVALFDAYAWDVANLVGVRAKYSVCDSASILGYYRHEADVGEAATRRSEVIGLSLQQKIGDKVTFESGIFSVHGSDLRFQETTTGINHALGSSMMIYAKQFAGGADSGYLKAVAKLGKTTLYGLYNYTWQKDETFDGQELNIVVKQQIVDNLTVAFKGGIGTRNAINGDPNTTATDVRLFVTYTF